MSAPKAGDRRRAGTSRAELRAVTSLVYTELRAVTSPVYPLCLRVRTKDDIFIVWRWSSAAASIVLVSVQRFRRYHLRHVQLCCQSPQHAAPPQPSCRLGQHHAVVIALSRLRPPLPHSQPAARSAVQRPRHRPAPLLRPCHSLLPSFSPAAVPCCRSQGHHDSCHTVRLLCASCG